MQPQRYSPDVETAVRIRRLDREAARRRAALERRWHTIYKLYNAKGRLLYVGISATGLGRLPGHRDKPWWRKVASAEFEHVKGRTAAEQRELELIRTCDPVHNTAGKPAQVAPLPPAHEVWTPEQKTTRVLRTVRDRRSTAAQIATETEIPAAEVETILACLHDAGRVRPFGSVGKWIWLA